MRQVQREDRARDRERRASEREHGHAEDARVADRTEEPEAELARARGRLRGEIGAYAREQRRAGDPAERMLVHLKAVLCASHPSVAYGASLEASTRLNDEIVSWAIQAYYGAA